MLMPSLASPHEGVEPILHAPLHCAHAFSQRETRIQSGHGLEGEANGPRLANLGARPGGGKGRGQSDGGGGGRGEYGIGNKRDRFEYSRHKRQRGTGKRVI